MNRGEDIQIVLSKEALLSVDSRSFVALPEAGAIVIFEGMVRNHTSNKSVLRLEFEAYEPMAILEMEKISQRALEQFEVHRVSIQHRIGILGIGEVPVIIAASASHRKAAFQACEFMIDELKNTVPIWKKEVFSNGEEWVSAHP